MGTSRKSLTVSQTDKETMPADSGLPISLFRAYLDCKGYSLEL